MGSCGDVPKVLLNIFGHIMVYQGGIDEAGGDIGTSRYIK
jgi:hypothetical protein